MKKNTHLYLIKSDPLYQNQLLAKFINSVMKEGKKSVAQTQVYNALKDIEKKGQKALDVFTKAIDNVSPRMEVRAKRVGGAAYQVPSEVRGNRKTSLAFRWIIESARRKSNKDFPTFALKLASELLDASRGEGEAIKKRSTTHKMAEANKVFSHFRW